MRRPDRLPARARLWQWTARALWYPEPVFAASLANPAAWTELAELAAKTADERVAAAVSACRQACDELDDAAEQLAAEHTYLFSRQVKVPAHETAYQRRHGDRVAAAAELGGFYAAFGFQVGEQRQELPDHVCLESEFVAALLAKEAYAAANRWHDRARLTRRARRKFVAEHLGAWLAAFGARLSEHARLAFYPTVVELGLVLASIEAGLAAPAPASLVGGAAAQ